MKVVVLSMDVEDWYHLEYFNHLDVDKNYSMLDGLDVYVKLLEKYQIKSSFFSLDTILKAHTEKFVGLLASGHDVGSHGRNHVRPLLQSLDEFRTEMVTSYELLKSINKSENIGYRAPCFSMDRERLDIVRDAGFTFDASKINFGTHPLYGNLDLNGFEVLEKFIYQCDGFTEFEANTIDVFGRKIPSSGGGYLRIFPWYVTKLMLLSHTRRNEFYNLYIHPFELSKRSIPDEASHLSPLNRIRFKSGQKSTIYKLEFLINFFGENGYAFTTYRELTKSL